MLHRWVGEGVGVDVDVSASREVIGREEDEEREGRGDSESVVLAECRGKFKQFKPGSLMIVVVWMSVIFK